MRFALPVICAIPAIVLSACLPEGDYLYSKPGVTLAQYHADRDACLTQSDKAAEDVANGRGRADFMAIANAPKGSPSYRRGNAMATASNTIREECLSARGYIHVPLSAREQDALRAIPDFNDKLAWMDDFVVRHS